jgi:hypothetical protein
MAKKKSSTKSTTSRKRSAAPRKGRRKPQPITPSCPKDPAARQALYRWYLVTIEQVLLEATVTSPENSGEFIGVLRKTINEIYKAGKRPTPVMALDDECDDGYECCPDGLCAPMCTFEG